MVVGAVAAIESTRGLLVACLRATGRTAYAINPLAVARYRERHTVARSESDHADALTLANILRDDTQYHRPLPQDSELVQAIAILAGASRTPPGTGSSSPTSSARSCASTFRRPSRRSS